MYTFPQANNDSILFSNLRFREKALWCHEMLYIQETQVAAGC
jgi:hypothetical protein